MEKAAETSLPKLQNSTGSKEIWKIDQELNNLLDRRKGFSKTTIDYKSLTRDIKKRVRFLRNKKM